MFALHGGAMIVAYKVGRITRSSGVHRTESVVDWWWCNDPNVGLNDLDPAGAHYTFVY